MALPNVNISDDVRIKRINGSLARGGWEVQLDVMRDTDLLAPYQRVDLWWTGVFGTGTYEILGRPAFTGHVIPQRLTFDRHGSEAAYTARTSDGFLSQGWLQGIHFVDTDAIARTSYHRFDSITGAPIERMTMGRIVKHLLGYYDELGSPPATNPDWVSHTNLVYHITQNPHGWIDVSGITETPFADPANLNGSMRTDHYIVRETNNLWSTIRQVATNEFFVAYFDKENNFYYQRHPMYSTVLPTPVMEFDEDFCIARPIVEVRHTNLQTDVGTIRQVILHAVQDDGSTIHSRFPASPTHVYGRVHEQTYIRCNSQDALDWWAQVHYYYLNREYTVRWQTAGPVGLLFDLLDRVEITYTGTAANGVHLDWTEKKFWIHEITVDLTGGFSGTTIFTLESESIPP